MDDALKAALRARGSTRGKLTRSSECNREDTTMQDFIDVIKRKLGFLSLPECAYVQVRMCLLNVGSTTLVVPTEEERPVANVEWNSLR